MRMLKLYERWGLTNKRSVFDYLIKTFLKSLFSWKDFTDFDKVKLKLAQHERELNLLNVLIGKKNIESEFLSLLKDYPKVREILPLLISVRPYKFKTLRVVKELKQVSFENTKELFDPSSPLTEDVREGLLNFFKYSGLEQVFLDKTVKNLVDYYFGIEVGLDSNARKNRVGKLMESLLQSKLEEFKELYPEISFVRQATKETIKEAFDVDLKIDKANRKFDFAVFNSKKGQLYIIETNFYSGGGSKLKSTAGEYQYLNDILTKQGVNFIWVTDGAGWNSAKKPLYETFLHNDYVFNLNFIKRGVLKIML